MSLKKKIFSASLILAGVITLSSCTYIDSLKDLMNGSKEESSAETSSKTESSSTKSSSKESLVTPSSVSAATSSEEESSSIASSSAIASSAHSSSAVSSSSAHSSSEASHSHSSQAQVISTASSSCIASSSTASSGVQDPDTYDELHIYSIEMHDKYGDSLFITYGDYDILIDAGDDGDGEFVNDFVKSHISSDNTLDLLVVTHCHSDHMGGLVKMNSYDKNTKALDNVDKVNNIIDFGHQRSTNTMYTNYATFRQALIDNGANYYPAYNVKSGGTTELDFDELNVEIIDTNYYASTDTDLTASGLNYNEYSVALLISLGDTKLFCAGDLEDAGEAALIANASNTSIKDITEEDTVIYKSCHHGTDVGDANNVTTGATSNNGGNRMALLSLIKPDYCFVSSAISQSAHPYARAVATMLFFTDKLYFNGTNGTLDFTLKNGQISVSGAGATTNYMIRKYSLVGSDDYTIDFATDTTYYTKSGDVYTEVLSGTTFDKNAEYYVPTYKSAGKGITWEDGVTYYTRSGQATTGYVYKAATSYSSSTTYYVRSGYTRDYGVYNFDSDTDYYIFTSGSYTTASRYPTTLTYYTASDSAVDYESQKDLVYTETEWYKNATFAGTAYSGITLPTIKEEVESYLTWLRANY